MTISNNILFAKYLGMEHTGGIYYSNIDKRFLQAEELKFNSNWNWLMEVVNKIYSGKKYIESKEYRNFCLLKITDDFEKVNHTCLEFVKWYQSNCE